MYGLYTCIACILRSLPKKCCAGNVPCKGSQVVPDMDGFISWVAETNALPNSPISGENDPHVLHFLLRNTLVGPGAQANFLAGATWNALEQIVSAMGEGSQCAGQGGQGQEAQAGFQ